MARYPEKFKTRAELARLVRRLRRRGAVVGLTNGVFDLVHAGHVAYLAEARRRCDVLIVSLNTDASARRYKGPTRPLVPLRDRLAVIAALASVDHVTVHGERRMAKALEAIKPDLYIKGGDYDVARLTSRGAVERHGGKAIVVPMAAGRSTTALMRAAAAAYLREGRRIDEKRPAAPAAFVDRDGVILKAVPYLFEPEKAEILPGAVEGLRRLRRAGFRVVVVTNQPAIGMGYCSIEEFFAVNSRMLSLLRARGIMVDGVYFCPHSLAFDCSCRKPRTGLLERAAAEQDIDVARSWFFGDRETDMEAARRFGIPAALVGAGDTPRARRLARVRGRNLRDAVRAALALAPSRSRRRPPRRPCAPATRSGR